MNAGLIAGLRAQLGGPRDGALLRYSLGNALLAQGDLTAAIEALREAIEFDSRYSAAWKALGRAQAQAGDAVAAIASFEQGIAVAQARGDVQAAKEMNVFLNRLRKAAQ
ncbi:MAG: tetratricopeptide repeat protein [Dokdonella sp.]|uniref:tetratricopeptide repeat protein n=1 Tax=Dokdonella sp. TaxID=2291710 RepID=UPI0025C66354|nr:tetratricopeptide repeat protein [Dokdonella sp.]MBZ0222255.1 tetratricopeptide repeat protein [Dokdonella sp.]MCC7255714.1 tetratricopeptide repeat protein [Dokdonella sp.]